MNSNLFPFRGHSEITHRLLELAKHSRLPHALLFTGPEGIGKRKVAEYLGQALLCASEDPPCGRCGPCELTEAGKHPDLARLEAEGERIKIDRVRELIRDFAFSPLIGSTRVVLVPEAHTFHPAAANALLKTLEEPPAGTYFFFVTHSPGWIPRTIVSRCQIVRFPPLLRSDLEEILRENGIQPDPELMNWAMGSAKRALSLSEVREEIPSLQSLMNRKQPLAAERAYALAQGVAERETLEPVLQGLLSESHQLLTTGGAEAESRFALLCFTDKLLEMRRRLKLNLNVKISLTRLLLFFREGLESRLEI